MKNFVDLYSDQILHSWLNGVTQSPWVELDRPWLKIVPKNFPRTLDYPEIPLFEICDQAAQKFKNNVSVCMIPQNVKYTYLELKHYSDKLATALTNRFDIGKGESVGIMTWNSPEYVFSLFGVLKTGASCTLINPLVPIDDVKYTIDNAEIVDTLIVDETLYSAVKEIEKIEHFITIGEGEIKEANNFWQLIEPFRPQPPSVEIDPKNDVAALIYTGGTTGKPKGVVLTHYCLLANALQCAFSGRHPDQVRSELGKGATMIFLPICHIGGFTMLLTALYEGSMNILASHFELKDTCEAIEKYRVTKFPVVPTMIVYLTNFPDLLRYDFSSIEICGSGAFALPPEVAKKFEELTGVKIVQGYGLTECCAALATNPVWAPSLVKPESVGTPIIDTDAKIVDPDTGKELPLGKVGEAWWRGPQIMKEYWKAPKETKETLANGWLRSGDLAKMDERGYIYIVERLKDIIKYKGYKIFPDEIEAKLHEHPAVTESAVVGVRDPVVGETIKAFVVLKNQFQGKVTEQEIVQWAKEKMGPIKYPRFVEFIESIPKTLVGKPSRRLLRETHTRA